MRTLLLTALVLTSCGDDDSAMDASDVGLDSAPADTGFDTARPGCTDVSQCAMSPNTQVMCLSGTCLTIGCLPGFGDCDDDRENGCEVSLLTSLEHCSGCRAACMPANATAVCVEGACTIDVCDEGFIDCDTDPETGCEATICSSK